MGLKHVVDVGGHFKAYASQLDCAELLIPLNMLPLLYHASLWSTTTHSLLPLQVVYIYIEVEPWPNNMGHLGNLMGTWWEHLENLMGTPWELDGNTIENLMGTPWELDGNTIENLMGTPWELYGNTLRT